MKRSRFSDEQIISVLKEQEAGMATADVCRRHGISSATFYKWKAKYGGLEVSDAGGCGRWRRRTLGSSVSLLTPCSITPCSRRSAQKCMTRPVHARVDRC